MSDLYRVTTVFTGPQGMPGTHTIHGQASIQSANDFITLVGEFWGRLMGGFGSGSSGLATGLTSTTLGTCDVIDSSTGQITGTDGDGSDIVHTGNGTAEPLPHFVQGLAQVQTVLFINGRRLRGRFFIPGITEQQSTNGAPDATWRGQVQDELDLLVESAWAVYSPTHHEFASANSTSTWSQFATLRSRRD